jgi:hypothetical protein
MKLGLIPNKLQEVGIDIRAVEGFLHGLCKQTVRNQDYRNIVFLDVSERLSRDGKVGDMRRAKSLAWMLYAARFGDLDLWFKIRHTVCQDHPEKSEQVCLLLAKYMELHNPLRSSYWTARGNLDSIAFKHWLQIQKATPVGAFDFDQMRQDLELNGPQNDRNNDLIVTLRTRLGMRQRTQASTAR